MLSTTDSILVTGGVGFVGSALVGELLEATGATRITVLDNFFNDGANRLGQGGHRPADRRSIEEGMVL